MPARVPARVPEPAPSLASGGRRAGFAATLLVHVALIGLWQIARTMPRPIADGARTAFAWIYLPAPPQPQAVVSSTLRGTPPRTISAAPVPAPATAPITAPAPALPAPTQSLSIAEPSMPTAASILDYARHNAGAIDRAVRKENRPYIVGLRTARKSGCAPGWNGRTNWRRQNYGKRPKSTSW